MTHEHTIDKLGAWLDGELPPAEAEDVRRHVEQCSRCAARVDELRRLDSALDLAPTHNASGGFAGQVRRAAERRVPARPAGGRIWLLDRMQAAHPVVMRMAAGLVVLAGLVVGVLAGLPEPAGPAPTAQQLTDPAVDALSAAPRGSLADAALAFYTAGGRDDS
jgi:anti-sigma factor RsiW